MRSGSAPKAVALNGAGWGTADAGCSLPYQALFRAGCLCRAGWAGMRGAAEWDMRRHKILRP